MEDFYAFRSKVLSLLFQFEIDMLDEMDEDAIVSGFENDDDPEDVVQVIRTGCQMCLSLI